MEWFWEERASRLPHHASFPRDSAAGKAYIQAVETRNVEMAAEQASYLLLVMEEEAGQDLLITLFQPGG